MQDLAGSENLLTQTLGRLFALAEAYPDLKANQNMLRAAGGADLDREPDRLRPAGLQRLRDDLQQRARDVPGQPDGQYVGFRRAALFEIEARRSASAAVSF